MIIPGRTFAQSNEVGIVDTSKSSDIVVKDSLSTDSGRVDYELPYPGMLPDNPFYFLKMLRDKIVKSLINDPFERAKFDILTSQKRMFAGKLLLGKKKEVLAIETIEKSNNYLDDTLNDTKEAKLTDTKGVDIQPFYEHFKTVVRKHIEIMADLKKDISKKNAKRFEIQQKRIEEVEKNVELLIKEEQ